jgi:hypothetical protein
MFGSRWSVGFHGPQGSLSRRKSGRSGPGDAMFNLYRAQGDEERKFLDLASKPRLTVSPGLASKLVATGFPLWASKLAATVW